MKTADLRLLWFLPALFMSASIASAEEPEHPGHPDKARHCLSLSAIRQVEVIDNRNILFRMAGGSKYVSVLPRPCPGLTRQKTIMYRTSLNQLCDLDVITVLDNVGFGLMPGASCGLGRFHPVDDDAVEGLREGVPIDRYEEDD